MNMGVAKDGLLAGPAGQVTGVRLREPDAAGLGSSAHGDSQPKPTTRSNDSLWSQYSPVMDHVANARWGDTDELFHDAPLVTEITEVYPD